MIKTESPPRGPLAVVKFAADKALTKLRSLLPQVGEMFGVGESSESICEMPAHFDWRVYLGKYVDLRAAGIGSRRRAMEHFRRHGAREGRSGQFNDVFYRGYYADLTSVLFDREACIRHWLTFGAAEGRSPSLLDLLRREECPKVIFELIDEFDPPPLPGIPKGEYWRAWVGVLTQQPPTFTPLWGDAERDDTFYFRLVSLFDEALQDHRAKPLALALQQRHPGAMNRILGNLALRAARSAKTPGARIGGYRLAKDCLASALDHAPDCALARLSMGAVQLESGDVEQALVSAEEGIRLRPDMQEFETALKYVTTAMWDEATTELDVLAASGRRDQVFTNVERLVDRVSQAQECLVTHGGGGRVHTRINREKVLLVADLLLPQCRRYRVEQKREQLEAAGYRVEVVGWPDTVKAAELLLWNDQIIFYRCPALLDVVRLMTMARALGKVVIYEIDDLVFDPIYPPPIESYGGFVSPFEYLNLVKGSAFFRAAARQCDFGIASTRPLQRALAPLVRSNRCFLHRNGLDRQSPLNHPQKRHVNGDDLVIFYGTATKAHNADFVEHAWPGIARALNKHPRARLCVVGHLNLPPDLIAEVGAGQLEQIPMQDSMEQYWALLSKADINLATLSPDVMTDGKSELKWFEAAVLGVPSVVSPTENYRDVVRHEEDVLLAEGPEQWFDMLDRLLSSADERRRLARNARKRALDEYGMLALSRNIRSILDDCADFVEADIGALVAA